jgi:protein-S-isoprenylcysteine O-methyltransferase Ste14
LRLSRRVERKGAAISLSLAFCNPRSTAIPAAFRQFSTKGTSFDTNAVTYCAAIDREIRMKATAWEFRLRIWILAVLFLLGFAVPWNYALHLDGRGPNAHLWGWSAAMLAKSGVTNIGTAFNVLLAVGVVLAFAAAVLRTWAAAYLGSEVVQEAAMHSGAVVQAGPFRHMRNPLYVGTWLMTLALALLMPPSGAVFAVVTVVLFQFRLILGEEAFLSARLGEAYRAYAARVPRLFPSLRARVPASGAQPRWAQAVLSEIFPWGVAISFAAVGWRYDAQLLGRCVLVSLGVWMVVRGVMKPASKAGIPG